MPWSVTAYRYTMHVAALATIVSDGAMQNAAIIPHSDGAFSPPDSRSEFGPHGMRKQIMEQWCALLFGHVLETNRIVLIDE